MISRNFAARSGLGIELLGLPSLEAKQLFPIATLLVHLAQVADRRVVVRIDREDRFVRLHRLRLVGELVDVEIGRLRIQLDLLVGVVDEPCELDDRLDVLVVTLRRVLPFGERASVLQQSWRRPPVAALRGRGGRRRAFPRASQRGRGAGVSSRAGVSSAGRDGRGCGGLFLLLRPGGIRRGLCDRRGRLRGHRRHFLIDELCHDRGSGRGWPAAPPFRRRGEEPRTARANASPPRRRAASSNRR